MIVRTERERDAGIERRLGWLFALGGCIVILDQTIFKLHELALWAPWWNAAALVLIAGIVVLAAGGLFLPPSVLRVLWWSLPILYVVLQLLWAFAFRGPDLTDAVPWTWTVEPPVVTLLLLVLRPAAAIGASLGISLAPMIAGLAFLGEVPHAVLRETPIQLANVVYVAIFLGVYLQLRMLRAQELEVRGQREQQTRAAALAAEHARVSRVVHDEVLSALAAAIQTEGSPPMVLKRAAAGALAALDESIDHTSVQSGALSVQDAMDEIVAVLRAIDGDFALRVDLSSGSMPRDVTRAASLAAAEALRNSLRHAGPGARREVRLELSDHRMRVTIFDDGVGFDTGYAREGMGIPESIERRMLEVGGSAVIRSHRGAGTEVRLSWSA